MSWLTIGVVVIVGFVIFRFLVKPLFKIIALVALALIAYFWLWPLLTN